MEVHVPVGALSNRAGRLRLQPAALPWAIAAAVLAFPADGTAQRALGQIVDQSTRTPVPGALVTVRDNSGELVGMSVSDSRGEYSIDLPHVGPFSVSARSPGYEQVSADGLTFSSDLPTLMHFELDPDPVRLEGITVEVGAETRIARELSILGLRPMELGDRLVTRAEIEQRQTARDIGAVLEWQQIPGAQVARTENTYGSNGPGMLCVYLARGRTGSGKQRCALTVLDGLPVQPDVVEMLDPADLEAIIVLNPQEATVRFGTLGGGGAVLLITRVRH